MKKGDCASGNLALKNPKPKQFIDSAIFSSSLFPR
jgi:hypothetical protein